MPETSAASGAWTTSAHRLPGPDTDVGLVRPALAAGLLGGVVGLFLAASELRHLEACLSALLARGLGLPGARAVGETVLFTADGRAAGYHISLGCTVAFLLLPFSAVTAVLLVIRRVPALRSLASLLAAVATIVACNQLRLLSIGGAMAAWGPEVGYARTHVLVGTVISTLGVVLGGSVYLAVLLRGGWPEDVADRG